MRKRLAMLFIALGVAGALGAVAPGAGAQEATLCLKAKVVVNGEALVDVDECHALPPAE